MPGMPMPVISKVGVFTVIASVGSVMVKLTLGVDSGVLTETAVGVLVAAAVGVFVGDVVGVMDGVSVGVLVGTGGAGVSVGALVGTGVTWVSSVGVGVGAADVPQATSRNEQSKMSDRHRVTAFLFQLHNPMDAEPSGPRHSNRMSSRGHGRLWKGTVRSKAIPLDSGARRPGE